MKKKVLSQKNSHLIPWFAESKTFGMLLLTTNSRYLLLLHNPAAAAVELD